VSLQISASDEQRPVGMAAQTIRVPPVRPYGYTPRKKAAPIGPVYASYGGFITRALAMIIDLLIIGAVVLIVDVSLYFFVRTSIVITLVRLFTGTNPLIQNTIAAVLGTTFRVGFALVFGFLYFTVFYTIGGSTIGKHIMGLRVVTKDGQHLTFRTAVLRVLAYAVSALLYLGFLAILLDDRRRAWHDRIAGTCVVHTWDARPDETFLRAVVDEMNGDAPRQ